MGDVRARPPGPGAMLALACAFALTLVSTAWFMLELAGQQDRDQLAHELRLARFGLEVIERDLRRPTRDYAIWDEAYRAIVLAPDRGWLRDNLGRTIHENYGVDYAIVLDGTDRPVYLADQGVEIDPAGLGRFRHGLEILASRARLSTAPEQAVVTGYVTDEAGPVLLAAEVVRPYLADPGGNGQPHGTVLFFGKRIDVSVVDELRARLGLAELRVSSEPDPDQPGRLSIMAADGTPIHGLQWRTAAPGRNLTTGPFPFLGIAMACLAVLACCMFATLRRVTMALSQSERRFRDIADATSDWIFETDAALRLTYVSDRLRSVLGGSSAEVLARPLHDLLVPGSSAERGNVDRGDRCLARILSRGLPVRELICRSTSFGPTERHVRLAAVPISTGAGAGASGGWRGTLTDVTSEIEARDKVEFLAFNDALTGVANRARFHERLASELATALPEGRSVAVLYLDLDRFKPVNDTYGHELGDQLLRAVTTRLQRQLRSTDLLARLGGDEFGIILPGMAQPDHVEELGKRLVVTLSRSFAIGKVRVSIGVSIGAAIAPLDGQEPETILRHADRALYQAKSRGRNQLRLVRPEEAEDNVTPLRPVASAGQTGRT